MRAIFFLILISGISALPVGTQVDAGVEAARVAQAETFLQETAGMGCSPPGNFYSACSSFIAAVADKVYAECSNRCYNAMKIFVTKCGHEGYMKRFTYFYETCKSTLPTAAPTQTPTEVPTTRPPSPSPSHTPTENPTSDPTHTPTRTPTDSPTAVPTDEPSRAPTNDPTFAPSHAPTAVPTEVPTAEPTAVPTEEPTTLPPTTDKPSFSPTVTPTEEPSAEPSIAPTAAPTAMPSQSPTAEPTQTPTEASTAAACKDVLRSDVAIVMDSSNSILAPDWEKLSGFTQQMLNDFPISNDRMNVAGVQFASKAGILFPLTGSKTAAMSSLKQVRRETFGWQTRTDLAVEEAMQTLGKGRDDAKDIMLVVTDGVPTGGSNPGSPADKAFAKAKAAGVKVVFVLVGWMFKLMPMPSHWSETKPIIIDSYTGLESIRSQVVGMVCKQAVVTAAPKQPDCSAEVQRLEKEVAEAEEAWMKKREALKEGGRCATKSPLAIYTAPPRGSDSSMKATISTITFPPFSFPEPTAKSTAEETQEPTAKPTVAPTEEPTAKPTATPTETPTTLPPTTDEPSFSPTHTPTEHPTAVPTATPTDQPTRVPTRYPTRVPTRVPTRRPTAVPLQKYVRRKTATPTPAPVERCCKAAASCRATGDPHYLSFDGKKFDFFGLGEHYLMKSSKVAIKTTTGGCKCNRGCQSWCRNQPSFNVKIEIQPVGSAQTLTIENAPGIGGYNKLKMTTSFAGASIAMSRSSGQSNLDKTVVTFASLGLRVRVNAWQYHKTRGGFYATDGGIDKGMDIWVETFSGFTCGKVTGLCGNLDCNMHNDLPGWSLRSWPAIEPRNHPPSPAATPIRNFCNNNPTLKTKVTAFCQKYSLDTRHVCMEDTCLTGQILTGMDREFAQIDRTNEAVKADLLALTRSARTLSSSIGLLRGKASQSSEGWGGKPSRAIDGNTNQRYPSNSCTHTHRAGRPWWKLDFGSSKMVSKVQVWNRADCCNARLAGALVKVGTSVCGTLGNSKSMQTINCNNKVGTYLMIQQARSDYLTLCEVKVYGKVVARKTKYTAAFGGNGGGALSSHCPDGKYINYWKVKTGSLVDRIQGRCNNGTWLKACGGSGGGWHQGGPVWGFQKMHVRTGSLVDKFNNRGGNGGAGHWMDCGSGYKITGYNMRCGSLVDRVQMQCKNV